VYIVTWIVGNLDCESRWGNKPLPAAIRRRLAYMSTLLRALVTEDDAIVLTLTDIDTNRLPCLPELPRFRCEPLSVPLPTNTIAWAGGTKMISSYYDPGQVPWRLATLTPLAPASVCTAVNDRRLTIEARRHADVELAGAAIISGIDQLSQHLDQGGADFGDGHWICKAPWTAAGRDRVRGRGKDRAAITAVAKLLRQCGGELVFEPWLPKLFDLGVLATVHDGRVTQRAPHQLLCNAHGGFAGISLVPPPLTTPERDLLHRTVALTGSLLAQNGYCGPFTIDSFVHTAHGKRQMAPLCEINARLSFGWVALALTSRLGGDTMMVGSVNDCPATATQVLSPGADDPFCVWLQ
jgi:hypothetical protein